jgi:heme A synthase
MESVSTKLPRGGADILALGFGTTLAMWVVGYVGRLPGVDAPSMVVGTALLGVALLGGALAGRLGPRGLKGAALSGLLSATLNLLVLGSLLAGPLPNRLVPTAAFWVPGFLLAGAVLGLLGGALGIVGRRRQPGELPWTFVFVTVAAVATFVLLVVGGLVTSHGAGLAVVDWPSSFGYNMFLYPLSRMTGGIFFEHAHRLLGSLVGLTILVLALHLASVDERPAVRLLAFGALAMVVVQGILGGLRVTGHFTTSTSPADVTPSLSLAVAHGVLGQLVLAALAALVTVTSPTWRRPEAPTFHPAAAADRALSIALSLALLGQLVLGAVQRHLGQGLLLHIAMAAVVTVVAMLLGARAWALGSAYPVVSITGRAVLVAVSWQLLLGISVFVVRGGLDGATPREGWRAVLTMAHQATGAKLLALSVALALLIRRQLAPPPSD